MKPITREALAQLRVKKQVDKIAAYAAGFCKACDVKSIDPETLVKFATALELQL